jgi:hypothetical protein
MNVAMNVALQAKSPLDLATQRTNDALTALTNDAGAADFSCVLSGLIKPTTKGDESSRSLAGEGLLESNQASSVKTPQDIEDEKLREAFHNFVGQTFFSQLLSSLRSTQEGAAYFNGGQAEKIFQGQLDQVLSEELTKSSADQIADPMFRLFQLQRSQ